MKSQWVLLGLTLVLLTFIIQESASKSPPRKDDHGEEGEKGSDEKGKEKEKEKEEPEDPWVDKKCQGKHIEVPKDFVKARTKCYEMTQTKDDDSDDPRGPVCESVCIWKELEFFTGKNLKVDSDAIDGFIDKVLSSPELHHGRSILKKEWKVCQKEIGDPEDAENKKCKMHKKFFDCILSSIKRFCKHVTVVKKTEHHGGLLHLNVGR